MMDPREGPIWRCRDRTICTGERPVIMGILNVTPDSFSDGGRYSGVEAAVRRGLEMAAEGADIIDIGGESTRPGAEPVPADQERFRVIPVVEALCRELKGAERPLLSVDTRKAEVAGLALEAGVHIVNDITALGGDPAMPEVVRRHGAGAVLMHMRGEPTTMQADPEYQDVASDVGKWIRERVADLTRRGLALEALAVDPGIGFGKTAEHNLQLLARLGELAACGRPVVVGLSRKRFLGKVTGQSVEGRLAGSVAGLVYAFLRGAHILRVHDVGASVDAARLVAALRQEERAAWNG